MIRQMLQQESQPANNYQEEFISTIQSNVPQWKRQHPPGVEDNTDEAQVQQNTMETNVEENLIEAVKSERCLYDARHVDYGKTKLKDSIWGRIAMALHFENKDNAKTMWQRLRRTYRQVLFRKNKVYWNTKPWRYKKNMDFLAPFLNKPSSKKKKNNDSDDDVYIVENDVDIRTIKTKNKVGNINGDTKSAPETSIADRLDKIIRDDDSNELNKKILEIKQKFLEREKNDLILNKIRDDPLFNFFVRMYESTKTFKTSSQHRIKRSIFALVCNEELNQIKQKECTITETQQQIETSECVCKHNEITDKDQDQDQVTHKDIGQENETYKTTNQPKNEEFSHKQKELTVTETQHQIEASQTDCIQNGIYDNRDIMDQYIEEFIIQENVTYDTISHQSNKECNDMIQKKTTVAETQLQIDSLETNLTQNGIYDSSDIMDQDTEEVISQNNESYETTTQHNAEESNSHIQNDATVKNAQLQQIDSLETDFIQNGNPDIMDQDIEEVRGQDNKTYDIIKIEETVVDAR